MINTISHNAELLRREFTATPNQFERSLFDI